MNKVKYYRVLGWVLLLFGLIGYFLLVTVRGFKGRLHFTFATISGLLTGFVLNVPVWTGLLLLWRADKDQYPTRKSPWRTVTLAFLILGAVVIGTIILLAAAFFLLWELFPAP